MIRSSSHHPSPTVPVRVSVLLLLCLTLPLSLAWTHVHTLTACAAQPTIVQKQSQDAHIHDSNESVKNPITPSSSSPSSDSMHMSGGIPLSQSSTTVIELIPVQQMKQDTTNTTPPDSSAHVGSQSKLVAIAVEPDSSFVSPQQSSTSTPLTHDESKQQSSASWKLRSSSDSSPSAKQEAVKSSPLSATEQELQQPISMSHKLKMSNANDNSIVAASPLTSTVRAKLHVVKRRALLSQGELIDDQFDLTSENAASDFGITPSTPLYEAILSHGDLSIPAFHLSTLPFLQPFVNLMQNAPCNLTAIFPASSAIWQQADYYLNKYCGKDSRFADSDSCCTFNHLHKLDDVVVDNGYEVSSNGLGNVQFTQMRVIQKLLKDATQRFINWNEQQSEDKRQVCDGETVFLPSVSDLQSVMDFVALKAITTGSGSGTAQTSSQDFSSDDNVDLLTLQWKLQQLRQSSNTDEDNSVSHPLALKLLQRIKSNLKQRAKSLRDCVTANQQQQPDSSGRDKQPSVSVDCPQPPYTPTSDSSDFPSSPSDSSSESDSNLPSSFQQLLFRVRPYRVSAFMQRAIQALVSYHMLGFSALTTDMPIHLFAPTLLNDPMFINFGNGWSQTNTSTGDNSQHQAQPKGNNSQESNSSSSSSAFSTSSSSPSSSSSFPFHAKLSQRQLNWPIKLHHADYKSTAFQFDTNNDSLTDVDADAHTDRESDVTDVSDSSSNSSDSSISHSSLSARSMDALIDIAIAHAFAVTPQEVNAPFDISTQARFAPSSTTPTSDNQSTSVFTSNVTTDTQTHSGGNSIFPAILHFEKTEAGVFIKMGAETSAWPSQAKIISPDIQVENGVIQIIDTAFYAPPKTTRVLRKNGVFAFGAAVRSVGREVADVVNYASGITLFVPQDSALAQIVAQLPDPLVKKLIKEVAKFKIKKLKIRLMKNKLKQENKEGDGEEDEQQTVNSPSQSTSSMRDFDNINNVNDDSDNINNMDIANGDDSSDDSLRSKLKHKLKMSLISKLKKERMKMKLEKIKMKIKMKMKNNGSDMDASDFNTRFNATSRLGQLATALRSLKASVPFDLAAWCQANGVNITQQQQTQQQQPWNPQQSALTSAQLSALLLSHVFIGVTPSSEFADGKSLQSVAGGNSVTLNCNGDNWSIGGANILFTDILTKNGMVHIVDKVIGGQQSSESQISPAQMKLISGFDFSDQAAAPMNDDSDEQDAKLMKLKIALARHWAIKHRLQNRGFSDADEDTTGSDNDNSSVDVNDDDEDDNDWNSARRRIIARLLARYLFLKNKLKQKTKLKMKQKIKNKFKQKLKSKWNAALEGEDSDFDTIDDDTSDVGSITSSDCLFHTSRHCGIVDTLQFNAPFQSMRQSSRALFSASNTPESTQCTSDTQANGTSMKLKSDSQDYFSLPTVSKCYSPREYLCRQGKLILKKAVKQRIAEARVELRNRIQKLKAKLKQASNQ